MGVASAGGGYEKLLMQHGVKHFKLDQTRKPIELIEAARGYRAIVKEFDPNIVHAHMMTGVVLASTLRFQSKYALVSTVHNEFQRSAVLMGLADRVIAVSKAVADSMVRRGIPEQKLRVISNGTLGSPRTCQLKECVPITLKHPAIVTVAGWSRSRTI